MERGRGGGGGGREREGGGRGKRKRGDLCLSMRSGQLAPQRDAIYGVSTTDSYVHTISS